MPDRTTAPPELEGRPDLEQLWEIFAAVSNAANREVRHPPQLTWHLHRNDFMWLVQAHGPHEAAPVIDQVASAYGETSYLLFGVPIKVTGEHPAAWPDHAPRLVLTADRRM